MPGKCSSVFARVFRKRCALPTERRVLIIPFTQELIHRRGSQAADRHNLEVLGWYTFLLRYLTKPFLPFKFSEERVGGLNFEGRPNMHTEDRQRFMDGSKQIYACEIGHFARELMAANPALIRRMGAQVRLSGSLCANREDC